VLGGSNAVFENGGVGMARRGDVQDLGCGPEPGGQLSLPPGFPSDPMSFVDFGDEWREGGS
jgi:hypothetical protein